jgi:hypothetical protein
MVLFLSKEYLDMNITLFSMLSTQLSPISLQRNTKVCGTLFSGGLRISPQTVDMHRKEYHRDSSKYNQSREKKRQEKYTKATVQEWVEL